MSERALAQRYRVSRNTVTKALAQSVPPKRKKPPPRASVLEPVKCSIDAMLQEDLAAPRKQKHTISRVLERLAAEHGFELAHTRRLPPDPRTELPDMAKYDRLLAPPAPPRKQQKGKSA